MTITRSEVVAAVRNMAAVIERWENAGTDEAPHVLWRGEPRKAISEAMTESWNALIDSVATPDAERDAQPIILAIDDFEAAMFDWAEMSELAPEDTNPGGSAELWNTWGAVIVSLEERPRKRLEPIPQLVIEKVSERQIALMYGWKQADGSPDVIKVREEIAKPGTHFDAEKWVHPEDARFYAEVAEKWAKRSGRAADDVVASAPLVAPESLDDLIRQDVPSAQIARMKGISADDVRQRAQQLGLVLDGQFVPSVSPHDRMQDIRDEDAKRRAELQRAAKPVGVTNSLPDRITSLAAEGLSPQQIADQLSSDHPNLTDKKVARVLQAAAKETANA